MKRGSFKWVLKGILQKKKRSAFHAAGSAWANVPKSEINSTGPRKTATFSPV